MLLLLSVALVPLKAQEKQSGSVYIPDLGIVIDAQPDTTNTVNMMMQTQSASAAYMESTRELRNMLGQLSGQIENLESSLGEDMAAMSLENNRLRSLIGRLQADREKERANALPLVPAVPSEARPQSAQRVESTDAFDMGAIMAAYVAGRYAEVLQRSAGVDEAALPSATATQLAYWRADANFRLGRFDEALLSLGSMRKSDHALGDDALILRGLVYMKQGKGALARSQFEAIISQYPTSDYYRLAEMTLREIHEL